MSQKVEFRELKRKDKKELRRLLKEQEGYEEFFENTKDAETYAKMMVEQYLGTCAYKKVAAVGERIVGAVIGSRKKNSSFLTSLKKRFCYIRLNMRKKNKEVLNCLSRLEQMEQELLREEKIEDENFIALFLIEKRYERTQIQEILLREWEGRGKERKKSCSYIVINGKITPRFFEEHFFLKRGEASVMIQPKEQRFRFYKALYRKNG